MSLYPSMDPCDIFFQLKNVICDTALYETPTVYYDEIEETPLSVDLTNATFKLPRYAFSLSEDDNSTSALLYITDNEFYTWVNSPGDNCICDPRLDLTDARYNTIGALVDYINNTAEKAIYILNDAIPDEDVLWKITAESDSIPIDFNEPNPTITAGSESISGVNSPLNGTYTYVLYVGIYEKYRNTTRSISRFQQRPIRMCFM